MFNLIYHKYDLTAQALQREVSSLLDVGCRDAVLKKHLPARISYAGLDLFPGPDVTHVANAEQGLPFADASYDAVVALDLLEHTNDIWFVYDELMRVARRQVIVLLPNNYHWRFRLQYLRGREMGKYILPTEPILDRHRWLLSYEGARRFCVGRAEAKGWTVREISLFGSRRTVPVDWLLSFVSTNLSNWSTIFVLERRGEAASS